MLIAGNSAEHMDLNDYIRDDGVSFLDTINNIDKYLNIYIYIWILFDSLDFE